MIIFDESTGKFRDSKTGRLRSDVSGLLSSNARRQYKEFAGNIDVKEYRRKLGQKSYNPERIESKSKNESVKINKSKKQRPVFAETSFYNYEDYIDDWMNDFDFVLEEDDTDIETP